MKKYIIVICSLFIQLSLNAQNNFTIVYQTTYQPYDSLKYNRLAPFHVIIQDSLSYCYMPAIVENTNIKPPDTLWRSYRAKSTFFDFKRKIKISQEGFSNKPKTHRLAVSKAEKGKWTIKGEEKTICGYRCIKASGKINQRTKIVWFAPDLPIGFGPYFIHGLPGTVLESHDEDGFYYSTAIQVKKGAIPLMEPNFCKRVKRNF